MKVIIEINCVTDAFKPNPNQELGRILIAAGKWLSGPCVVNLDPNNYNGLPFMDINNAVVGRILVKDAGKPLADEQR